MLSLNFTTYSKNNTSYINSWKIIFVFAILLAKGGGELQIEIKIEESCVETKVVVVANKMTDEVKEILEKLSDTSPKMLAGFKGDMVCVLDQSRISRIYAERGKAIGVTDEGEYILKFRLYELENMLCGSSFVRISNSEIINLKKVKSIDLSLSGTIRVKMLDGSVTYVSRRYVSKIKQVLGV